MTDNNRETQTTVSDYAQKARNFASRRKGLLIGSTVVAALAFGGVAMADQAKRHFGGKLAGHAMEVIKLDDANGDGIVTKDEMREGLLAAMSRSDANSDGGISVNEFKTLWTERTGPIMEGAFARIDVNGNGAISEEEALTLQMFLAEFLDRNGDDAISEDDMRRGKHRHRTSFFDDDDYDDDDDDDYEEDEEDDDDA